MARKRRAVLTAAAHEGEPMRRLMLGLLLAAGLGLSLGLGGCNTIAGAGKDVKAAGEAVSGTAEETKQGL
jgi:predicted small secreted protein